MGALGDFTSQAEDGLTPAVSTNLRWRPCRTIAHKIKTWVPDIQLTPIVWHGLENRSGKISENPSRVITIHT